MNLRVRYQAAFLFALTLGVYYPSLFAPLNSIDDHLLVTHLLNQNSFSFWGHFFPGGTSAYYRPLATLSFELDKYLWGLVESFMHLENILLHALNVLLVFAITRILTRSEGQENRFLPLVAAAIFALHPLDTEAVNWISARTDLMAGTFVYAALLLLLVSLVQRKLLWGIAGAASMFLGCLCKETALFLLPGVVCFLFLRRGNWSFCHQQPRLRFRLALLSWYSFSPLGYLWLRWFALHRDRGVQATFKAVSNIMVAPKAHAVDRLAAPVWEKLIQPMEAMGFYLKKLFVPFPLNFGIWSIDHRYIVLGVALLVLIAWFAWRRTIVSALGLTSFSLGVSALLVLLTAMGWTTIAERYVYVATGPFVVSLVIAIAQVTRTLRMKKVIAFATMFLLAGSAYATVSRNLTWQANLSLFRDTVRKSPDFQTAKNELAIALIRAHRNAEALTILKSIHVPESQESSLNTMTFFYERGEYDLARQFLLEKLNRPTPYEDKILDFLVKISYKMYEQSDDAEKKREYLLQIQSWLLRLEKVTRSSFVWYRLGRVALILGEKEQAQKYFAEAARQLPADSIYRKPAEKLAQELSK